MKIAIEQICEACEKKPNGQPCEEPCALWYRCLEGKEITEEDLLNGK